MITSHKRGHEIFYKNKKWYYSDDKSLADYDRPCIRCGRPPTKEGYDACQGHVEGATSVCCGHGVAEPILMMVKEGA